ncbi:amidohydrolase family protein [Peribacillus butanolivorans]
MTESIIRSGVIDADVHPWVNGDIKGLKPYLSTAWQNHFDGRYSLPDHPLRPPLAKSTSIRLDAVPPKGGVAGSDPYFMKEDLLDQHNIKYAVLTSIQAAKTICFPNPNEATTLARAFNDYFINEWLPIDPRFKLGIAVAAQDPIEAAKEIRRVGTHRSVVAVFLPLLNILMGNSHYYPIYEAAEECGLPLILHPTGTEGGFATSLQFAGGVPSTYIERHTSFPQIAMANLASLVFDGVFVRFPKLKVLAAEFGYSWLPHLLWRMDQNWKQFRREVPWIQKEPSQFVLEHVRMTTQPAEEPEKSKYLMQIFEMIHAEKTLMFSTDYPHWDNDFPSTTFRSLPDSMKQKIFHDNAAEFFGLESMIREELESK